MATSRHGAAPDQLALVGSFLNTIDLETGVDALIDTHGAQKWLASRRLSSPGTEYDEADRRRLAEVRGALRSLVAANGGAGVQRRAVTTLNEAARRVRLGVRLHPDDGYRLMAEGVGIDRPIGELLMGVTGAMAAGSWNRLKVCANEACQEAFYDSSRNRSGRWCSMSRCGNRMKGRTYRERHSGSTSASAVTSRPARARAEAAS
ncbi:MAG: CGNR zinc finger domain-containing protein [Candidatus Limnocylindrales bacterium]